MAEAEKNDETSSPKRQRLAPLLTTVIGAFPKPDYLKGIVGDWFTLDSHNASIATKSTSDRLKDDQDVEGLLSRATQEVLDQQINLGIAIPTDGEVRRENYIHYLCRSVSGISFQQLTRTGCRPSSTEPGKFAYHTDLPTVVGPVRWAGGASVSEEWEANQSRSSKPLKYTLPGPLTMIGTLANQHYSDDQLLGKDLALIIKGIVQDLVAAGCKQIQIDEPLYARQPERALAWGIDLLDEIVADVPEDVVTTVHICCGYPTHMDQTDYLKADPTAYLRLAPALDESSVKAVSIEDAHRPNDLPKLLPLFKQTTVVLGCVAVARSQIETQAAIEARLTEALKYIDRERLVVAPDCGLGFMQGPHRGILDQKLAATRFRRCKDPDVHKQIKDESKCCYSSHILR